LTKQIKNVDIQSRENRALQGESIQNRAGEHIGYVDNTTPLAIADVDWKI